MEVLIILMYVAVATLAVFGAGDVIRQINKLK